MVEVRRTIVGGDIVIDICGHAGYAPCGKDIVCASLSSAAVLLGRTARAVGLKTNEETLVGHYVAFIQNKGSAMAITDAFVEHIGVLSGDYPECVVVTDKIQRNNNGADGGTSAENS